LPAHRHYRESLPQSLQKVTRIASIMLAPPAVREITTLPSCFVVRIDVFWIVGAGVLVHLADIALRR
jgi:hypothetical protein